MTTAGVFETLARDVRCTVRGLRRSPLFTIVALLTLAAAIASWLPARKAAAVDPAEALAAE